MYGLLCRKSRTTQPNSRALRPPRPSRPISYPTPNICPLYQTILENRRRFMDRQRSDSEGIEDSRSVVLPTRHPPKIPRIPSSNPTDQTPRTPTRLRLRCQIRIHPHDLVSPLPAVQRLRRGSSQGREAAITKSMTIRPFFSLSPCLSRGAGDIS